MNHTASLVKHNTLLRNETRFLPYRRLARPRSQPRTTRLDRFLVMMTIIILPLDRIALPGLEGLPLLSAVSITYPMFALLTVYVLVRHLDALPKTLVHPVFLATYALLLVGLTVESFHPNSNYRELISIGQMIAGAVLLATICKDKAALKAGLYGYLIVGLWLSIQLFLTSYGLLQGASSGNYREATLLRDEIFVVNPLQANLNIMAGMAAQGAVIALALVLTDTKLWRRILFLSVTLFCFTATFLPLSRSGVLMVVISCAGVTFAYGAARPKTILVAGLIGASIVVWVPDVVWSRMTIVKGGPGVREQADGRTQVYTAAIEHFTEYAMMGVGSGNFWSSPDTIRRFGAGAGSHNGLLQVTIYWGVLGLIALIAVIFQVWRYIPRPSRNDGAALCIFGVSITLFILLMTIHNLYSKQFTVGLGLLVGARVWIWRDGVVRLARKPRRRRVPRPETSKGADQVCVE